MNPSSEDIAGMIEAESDLGLIFQTDLFIGREPSTPDNCVTIFDTPGRGPQLTFTKGEDYFYPSIQIRVRDRVYLDGWGVINDIKTLLHGKGQEWINGTYYSLIMCSMEPALLDWDESHRARFVATFEVQRR